MTQSPSAAAPVFSQPFWQAASEQRLIRPWCAHCQISFFPPALCCPHCLETGWTWIDSSGIGSIYSFTRVFRAPVAGFETPYVVAIVDLEPGFSLITNVLESNLDQVCIGDEVEVDWAGSMRDLPVFRRASAAGRRTS